VNEPKHTPAPWTQGVSNNNSPCVRGPNNELVAVVNVARKPDERTANAILISLAPDMLRELTELADWLESQSKVVEKLGAWGRMRETMNPASHMEGVRLRERAAQIRELIEKIQAV
jgi:hypothetical protein